MNRFSVSHLTGSVFAAALISLGSASAQGGYVHENGIGPDPDHDTNPATITRPIQKQERAKGDLDDPYRVIDFEVPPGRHGEIIREAYAKEFGVHFGKGVTRQVCEGQRRFYYDSICTYEAAPSGAYAAGYYDYLNAPLTIEFDQPVCVATLAIYPTGARQNEPFRVLIKGWDADGLALPDAETEFEWNKNTVRWKNMAGAYYIGGRAKKIEVSMKSGNPAESRDILRFLIDDVAFVQEGCDEVLADFAEQEADDIIADADEDLSEDSLVIIEGS
ncbi:hypothetical protein [Hyphococcus sp.]|uniref:hypothetical protein n=1 Tax=Hyphococcus sp. TaxID=2038636 RepID=UPI0035C749AB